MRNIPSWKNVGNVTLFTLLFIQCLNAYQVGVGRADVTGPPVQVVFMGYANFDQVGEGIHLRQYARTFIVDDDSKLIAFVNVDSCMMGVGVKRKVLKLLANIFNDTFTDDNVVISGIHTHSGPGGFLMDALFDISSSGFVPQTYDALVDGIVLSIKRAYRAMQPAKIYHASGILLNANINRSPSAYLFNPEEERKQYQYDVDKEMTQLKFVSIDGEPIGEINWYAVHATSMNNTNKLISADNMGYASLLVEQSMAPHALAGRSPYVAAFASSNLGDVSPNTKGPKCEISGGYCDGGAITCPLLHEQCFASGPGKDMFDSTRIIAHKLFQKAVELSNSTLVEVEGPVKYVHQFVHMPSQSAMYFNATTNRTEKVHGCSAAMGYSFAAGTTDGPGLMSFDQETKSTNPFWNLIRDFVATPTADDIKCQYPKPILLNTGKIKFPYDWQPSIVAHQLVSIGDFIIAAVPGELTTMSGRRLRNIIRNKVVALGGPSDTKVVIAGLSNIYSDYIVTPEEYQLQRYEAASTIYGPHTLTIHLNQYYKLTEALVLNKPVAHGPTPSDFSSRLISLTLPVIYDTPASGKFGDCLTQPPSTVVQGQTVIAKFVSGNPRNNLMHEKTYLTVEKMDENTGNWTVVATDSDWSTKFKWRKTRKFSSSSTVEVQWYTDQYTEPGTYRLRHMGYYKTLFTGTHAYQGATNAFTLSPKPHQRLLFN